MKTWIAPALVLFFGLPEPAGAATPAEMVEKADEYRVVGEAFAFDVKIINADTAKKTPNTESRYRVWVKGKEKSVVKFVAPAEDAGKALLMVGENLWMYFPSAARPLRLSLQQRLTGNVSNGDVARVNYSGDYDAVLDGEEKVEGKDCWRLLLTAKKDSTTYSKIKYWLAKDKFQPVKAEFFAAAGRLLKSAYYRNYQPILGRERLTEVVVQDGLQKTSVSQMVYSNYQLMDLKDSMFQQDQLKYLQ